MGWLSNLFGSVAPEHEARVLAQRNKLEPALDALIERRRAGGELSDADLEQCGDDFASYYSLLTKVHKTESNLSFPKEHRADFYLNAVRLAALGHPEHNAWPTMSGVRKKALPVLRARLESRDDPWLRLCILTPALLEGDVSLALASYERFQHDPFFRQLSLMWVREAVVGLPKHNRVKACEEFLSKVAPESPWESSGDVRPEHRWVLLCSVFPSLAVDPRTQLGDTRAPATVRAQMRSSYEIVDRESAWRTIDWLANEGHREELSAMLEAKDLPKSSRSRYVRLYADELKKHRIRAWDLGRLVALARATLTAGFLTRDEVLDVVDQVGCHLRAEFKSWDEFAEDYVLGVQYAYGKRYPDDDYLIELARRLQRAPDSPWRRLAFGTGAPTSP
jgi:hypothetical protein